MYISRIWLHSCVNSLAILLWSESPRFRISTRPLPRCQWRESIVCRIHRLGPKYAFKHPGITKRGSAPASHQRHGSSPCLASRYTFNVYPRFRLHLETTSSHHQTEGGYQAVPTPRLSFPDHFIWQELALIANACNTRVSFRTLLIDRALDARWLPEPSGLWSSAQFPAA